MCAETAEGLESLGSVRTQSHVHLQPRPQQEVEWHWDPSSGIGIEKGAQLRAPDCLPRVCGIGVDAADCRVGAVSAGRMAELWR